MQTPLAALLVLVPLVARAEPKPPPAAAKIKSAANAPEIKFAGKKNRVPAAIFPMDGQALKLPGRVEFEAGSDRLRPESDVVLEVVLDYLNARPDITLLRIEGHADGDGAPAFNQTISEKRAIAAARWLVAAGIPCTRLLPVGFGQTKPIAAGSTPDAKAQNTRIRFVNAALKGKPVDGAPTDGGGRVAGDPCR